MLLVFKIATFVYAANGTSFELLVAKHPKEGMIAYEVLLSYTMITRKV